MSIICPKCGSSNLTTTTKGFSTGKAVAGGLLFGPLGILAGTHGSSKIKIACLECGKSFYPSEGKDAYYSRETKKRNSQKINKVFFSSDFIQMIKNGERDKAVQLYKEQRSISLEESEEYISELEKKSKK